MKPCPHCGKLPKDENFTEAEKVVDNLLEDISSDAFQWVLVLLIDWWLGSYQVGRKNTTKQLQEKLDTIQNNPNEFSLRIKSGFNRYNYTGDLSTWD